MRKLHFGCGGRRFEGWENFDYELDLRHKLPFESDSIDYMFCNHTVEHLNSNEAYLFLEEAFRCLKPQGVFRVQVPSIEKIAMIGKNFPNYVLDRGGSIQIANRHIVLSFGHKSVYTTTLLSALLKNIGYTALDWDPRESSTPIFKEIIDKHFGLHEIMYDIETIAIEGTKP